MYVVFRVFSGVSGNHSIMHKQLLFVHNAVVTRDTRKKRERQHAAFTSLYMVPIVYKFV